LDLASWQMSVEMLQLMPHSENHKVNANSPLL
jgi:hypothetical protein